MTRPLISIVIALAPWRNAEILQSIKKQDYPQNKYEVIIEKGLNVPRNRNRGVIKATGDIIVFLDDDALIEKDFLQKVENFFIQYPNVGVLGGPQLTPKEDKIFARSNGYALAREWGDPNVNKRYRKTALTLKEDSTYITGAQKKKKKEVCEKIRFDPKVYPRDDVSFVESAISHGFSIASSPNIFIYHRRRNNLRALVEQIADYARLRAKDKLTLSNILFAVPMLFIIYLVLLPFLCFISIWFLFPLALYFISTLLFSIYLSFINKDFLSLFILPFVFLAIHLSYGLGFIIGLVDRSINLKKINKK